MMWREQDHQNCSTFAKMYEIDLEDFYTKLLLWDNDMIWLTFIIGVKSSYWIGLSSNQIAWMK